jgi:hypothetical protein
MRKIALILTLLFVAFCQLSAQIPAGINYQAVVRDASNVVIANRAIAMRFTLLQGGPSGTAVFAETHRPTTTDLGIVNLVIGQGTPQSGVFANINWTTGNYWLKVDLDEAGGTNFKPMGTTQLLTVPYAFHAQTVAQNNDADADPVNELQTLTRSGVTISLSQNGGSVSVEDADASPTNELQTLSRAGVTISLSQNGGSVSVEDADASSTNELQTLAFNPANNQLSISNGNAVTIPSGGTDADPDPTNEIQVLSKTGNLVQLSRNGGSFTDEVNDADADPANEVQNLTFNAASNRLSISGANSVVLPSYTDDQMLSLTGAQLSIENGNSVDLSAFSSPWQSYFSGIKYSDGTVRVDRPGLNEYVDILNHTIHLFEGFSGESYLRGSQLKFQKSGSPLVYDYGYGGAHFYHSGQPTITRSRFDADSVYFVSPGVGLLLPSFGKMTSFGSRFELGGSQVGTYNFWGVELNDNSFESHLVTDELVCRQILSPSDIFERYSLRTDGLRLANGAKWLNAFLGTASDNVTGRLELRYGTGMGPIAEIGIGDISTDGGAILLHAFGQPKAYLGTPGAGGRLTLMGPNDNLSFITASNFPNGGGFAAVCDTLGTPQIAMFTDELLDFTGTPFPAGHVYSSWEVFAPLIQSSEEDTIYTALSPFATITETPLLMNRERMLRSVATLLDPLVYIGSGNLTEGSAIFFGDNGSPNVAILANRDAQGFNLGAVRVFDAAGTPKAGVEVAPNGQGVVWGDLKNFRIDHPTERGKEIVYSSIEGPEAAAYVRGTARLVNGEVFVAFPDHFTAIANARTMTVILTPLSAETYGLAAVEKTANGIRVRELMSGKGNFEFDWEVKCIRTGYEDFQVIREKSSESLQVKLPTDLQQFTPGKTKLPDISPSFKSIPKK